MGEIKKVEFKFLDFPLTKPTGLNNAALNIYKPTQPNGQKHPKKTITIQVDSIRGLNLSPGQKWGFTADQARMILSMKSK